MSFSTIFNDFKDCIPQKGILHIGAHVCEERYLYYTINFFENRVLWIEAIQEIVEENKKNIPNINIINAVISNNDDEEVNFMITNNIQSSSIFNFKNHLIQHPDVIEVSRRNLKTISLNTLYDKLNLPYDTFDFITLDIQGAELNALKGASKILPHIKAIYTEVSIEELYEGGCLLDELDEFLKNNNFKRATMHMTKYNWGNALYIREN
jgi:FkbM family methyltransferase